MALRSRRNVFVVALFTGIFIGALAASVGDAQAVRHHRRHHVVYVRPQPASYVVDADTGMVMASENPDAPRYPASLTKMMTLYLTFEALTKDKLSLNDTLPVSAHAASQPQTNISLQPGDHIAVKDAILSIVVRSANDSAVTLGEALGGSEEEFARKMTQKAHALGMKHTFFHNASGLPDPAQHTTARDMAILGLALRNDFPQYFPLFKTESFSFRGLTYVTHNHVMMRYEGVDGIKTGYIRASGYNLVTSAMRDNHHIVAVVMGGSTIRERDDKMIALLDKSFTQMAALPGSNRVQYASSGRKVSAFPSKLDGYEEPSEGEGDRRYDDSSRNAESHSAATSGEAKADADQPHSALADLSSGGWGIQVGAYARVSDAQTAANRAIEQAPAELNAASVSITDESSAHVIHRSRLVNISEDQAEGACHKIAAKHLPCFVYKME
jgi:D-alanyl-D-alanine carboxypeptidase